MGKIHQSWISSKSVKMCRMISKVLLLLLIFSQYCLCDIVFGGKGGVKAGNAGNSRRTPPSSTCGCQCSNIGFKGSDGTLQGNCLSSDSGSGSWCYVDPACSSRCGDLQSSSRFPEFSWSYQACRTKGSQQRTRGQNDKSQFKRKKDDIQSIQLSGSRIGRLPSAPEKPESTQFTSESELVGKLADIINKARK